MADLPAIGKNTRLKIRFGGQEIFFPDGLWRITHATNSIVGGFWCQQDGLKRFKVCLTRPVVVEKDSPEKGLQYLYDFFQEKLLDDPSKWHVIDLFGANFWGNGRKV